jgi:hypothetical protein
VPENSSRAASWHVARRIAAAALGVLLSVATAATEESKIVSRPGEIEFPAVVGGGGFDHAMTMAGYHAVVWKDGRSASVALLKAEVSDSAVLEALSRIARPGPTLPMETWDERHHANSSAPDLRVSGPAMEVLLRLPGRAELVPLADLIQDSAGRGLDLRFSGNAANIPRWKSGCIVCLYSCPGGKVGNARYTDRDYAKDVTRFSMRPGALPPEGTRVGVVLRLRGPRPASAP